MNRQEMVMTFSEVFNQPQKRCDEMLTPEYEKTFQNIYIMDRFDGVFDGTDRHIKFVEWVKDNQPLVMRYHRLRMRHITNKRNEIQAKIWKLQAELNSIH